MKNLWRQWDSSPLPPHTPSNTPVMPLDALWGRPGGYNIFEEILADIVAEAKTGSFVVVKLRSYGKKKRFLGGVTLFTTEVARTLASSSLEG